MSKPKSTNMETQRFSGPELSELLDQVAREHGADAAISAVNRIRSGGVAGFFCREEFEVLVQPKAPGKKKAKAPTGGNPAGTSPSARPPKSDIQPSGRAAGRNGDRDRLDLSRANHDADAVPNSALHLAPDPAEDPRPNGRHLNEPHPNDPRPAAPRPDDAVFAGPRPVGGANADPFRALLERRLEQAADVEEELLTDLRRPMTPAPTRSGRATPTAPPAEPPELQPTVPAPGLPMSQPTVTGGVALLSPKALAVPGSTSSSFWLRLQQTQHELASFMPLASAMVATIGPLSLTTPIVRRLRTRPGLESAEVIVLTDRAEIVSEPTWQLVRSGHQLVDAVVERGHWPTLLLIDVPVELPNWVAPLENRLRAAGVGLFRYAVPGNPGPQDLEQYRLGSDVPYVIDLISRVQPVDLVDFVDQRHPIASVAGSELNAELLLAMREQVAIGT